MNTTTELSHRAIAILRAVADGRAEVTASSEPDLYIDGIPFTDQYTAHVLAHHGLIRAARLAAVGTRTSAALTAAGWSTLNFASMDAA